MTWGLARRVVADRRDPSAPCRGLRAGSGADRHRHRFDRRRAAGRHRHRCRTRRQETGSSASPTSAGSIAFRFASAPTRSPRSSRASRPRCAPDVQLLVGQTATLNLQMAPSTVQETVTVTGEAPLINLTNSSLGGNIDPRQVQELPVNGRNWMALALLAPGSRTRPAPAAPPRRSPLPDRNGGEAREFQLNVDGQQVSADIGTGGQPKYSQDSIAEFQFISNRFDATMGRSTGVQVNAITKSGTNQLSGLFRGNFRDSSFNAENPVLHVVEPIDNQQYSTALGGPIVKDKLHFFGNYEYEREPRTSIWNTPYPAFNVELTGTNNQKKGGVRLDYQLSSQTRLMGKVSRAASSSRSAPATQSHPAATGTNQRIQRRVPRPA